jgi:hypothetical protein
MKIPVFLTQVMNVYKWGYITMFKLLPLGAIAAGVIVGSQNQQPQPSQQPAQTQQQNDEETARALQAQCDEETRLKKRPKRLSAQSAEHARKSQQNQLEELRRSQQARYHGTQNASTSTSTSTSSNTANTNSSMSHQRQIDEDARLARQLQQQAQHNQSANVHTPVHPQGHDRNNGQHAPPHNRTVTHLRVIDQKGVSCGYHAAFNAKALDTLISQGTDITGNSVQQEARQYLPYIQKGKELTTEDIMGLADLINLHNIYIVSCKRHSIQSGGVHFDLKQDYAGFLHTIHQRTTAIGHFICNTGGHWVTFSIIKNAAGIQVFYMNSTNTPLEKDAIAQTLAGHIFEKLG